jgi:hypothetical protein
MKHRAPLKDHPLPLQNQALRPSRQDQSAISDINASNGFTTTSEWLAHDPAIQAAWKDFSEKRYEPMKQWARHELPSRIPMPRVVRYFFGGPDLLSVMAFFSEAPIYILCGTEPVGTMKSIEELTPEELQLGSAQIREVTKTFLLYGYFITKEMKNQMSNGPLQGVLPILLTFLILHEDQILSIEMMSLGGAPGVKIRFISRSGGQEQQLFYAQVNLCNDGSTSFLKWVRSFGSGAAYLKAASYLLHENEFSHAREFLLNESTTILQDDSGIPLCYFEKNRWAFYYFGCYQGPIELFKKYYQSELANASNSCGLRGPMPFGTGYQFNTTESGGANLLLAVKKEFVPKATEAK